LIVAIGTLHMLDHGERMGVRSSLLTPVMREELPESRRRISQNFSPAGVMSPFVARAMPTSSSDKRLRKYANLAAAAVPYRV